MPLRGKKPEGKRTRLKLLLSGEAGVGKTTAALQMPRPYFIDTEGGTDHYLGAFEQSGGAMFETTSIDETIAEVRTILTEKHDFLTLVIDPITMLWETAVDEAEAEHGNSFGKHTSEAGKKFKRLFALLAQLDMNVVVTAHSKPLYSNTTDHRGKPIMERTGSTFDGWKKLDYLMDLWLHLERDGKVGSTTRLACVRKSRLSEFPDQCIFPWGYEELSRRYGVEKLEKGSSSVQLASAVQLRELHELMGVIGEDGVKALKVDKFLKSFEAYEDIPSERLEKALASMRKRAELLNSAA